MNNKLNYGLLIILSGIIGILFVWNIQQKKKIDELTKPKGDISINPLNPETKPANPAGASPFDKPNVDPLADNFNPTGSGPGGITKIKFDRLVHDFGKIKQGDIVKTKFKFTNSGEIALVITNCQGSCGCTVPMWPQNPIKPGESADIDVQFDSHGKEGEVEKTVKVTANTNPPTNVLTIKSTINPKEK